jgi:catechol 2,3-dioxygenase-like lactoylglutathione lyase family enzyme
MGGVPVAATNLNHVSVHATDMEKSAKFYEDLFGLERVPTPNFGFEVIWLRVGDLQLHLFDRDVEAPSNHHLGITVDDIDTVYAKVKKLGIVDGRTNGPHLRELPDGGIQLYIRDPAGNLVEINYPDASKAGAEVKADIQRLSDAHPQSAENQRSTLFLAQKERSKVG